MPLKLLIADDSVTIHKVVDLAFEDADVHIFTAGDGQEALDKTNEVQPDIIIADSDMPKLNGFELCQKIKEDEKLKEIPLCLLHSDFEEFDEEKFRLCGADNHLSKPFKSEDIINKVAEMTKEIGKRERVENPLQGELTGEEDDFKDKDNLQEDLDEFEILPFDQVGQDIEESDLIELKPENEIAGSKQDTQIPLDATSDQEPSEDEIAKFMEEIDGWEEDEFMKKSDSEGIAETSPADSSTKTTDNLEKELEEFGKVLNIPEDELGTAEPFLEDESQMSNKFEIEKELNTALPEQGENGMIEEIGEIPTEDTISKAEELHASFEGKDDIAEGKGVLNEQPVEQESIAEDKSQVPDTLEDDKEIKTSIPEEDEKGLVKEMEDVVLEEPKSEAEEFQISPEETPESETFHEKIEEKEDMEEAAGASQNKKTEKQDAEEVSVNKFPREERQFEGDDLERLIGSFIKQAIEKILKEAIQNEIKGITGKIVKAVENVARDSTNEISRTVIQKEIQKLKDSKV